MKPSYKELETTLREVAKVLPELVETAGFGDECAQAVDRLIRTEDDAPAASSMNPLSDFDNAELLDMFSLLVSNATKSPLPEEEEKNLLEIQRELLRRMQDAAETHCRMGVACPLHDDQVHGQEASELRKQLEFFLEVDIYSIDETTIDVIGPIKAALQKILDSVDARDSLAFEEQNTNWEDPIVTQPGENLIENVNKARAEEKEARTEEKEARTEEETFKLCNRKWAFEKKELSDQELLYRYMNSNSQEDGQFTPAERARIKAMLDFGVARFDLGKSKWEVTGMERVELSDSVEGRLKKLEHQFEALEVLYKAQVQNSGKLDELCQSYTKNISIISGEFGKLFQRTDSLNDNLHEVNSFASRQFRKILYAHNRRHLQAPPKELAPGWARRRAQDVRSWAKSRQTAKLRGCR